MLADHIICPVSATWFGPSVVRRGLLTYKNMCWTLVVSACPSIKMTISSKSPTGHGMVTSVQWRDHQTRKIVDMDRDVKAQTGRLLADHHAGVSGGGHNDRSVSSSEEHKHWSTGETLWRSLTDHSILSPTISV